MKIDRGELLIALREFVQDGSGLIIGQPGAGKSYALAQLVEQFQGEEYPHLFILVDELGEVSEDDLRSALGYTQPTFAEALDALFAAAGETGTVIFDGFDAARNPTARNRLLGIIRSAVRAAPSQWTIIVSVRTYDATKSPTLLDAFSTRGGGRGGSTSSSFATRHFVIPELTNSEIESAFADSEHLRVFLDRASPALRELVRNPFNLWLLENVLEAGLEQDVLRPLSSQTQLLLHFWRLRVTEGALADYRTVILDTIVDLMVSDKVLTIRKRHAFDPDIREAWSSLHSSGVLKETGPAGNQVAFTHHILFDFAVSVLAIQDSAEAVVEFLEADVSRPLFLRPSLVHFFARLWVQDRDNFWEIFWTLLPHEAVPIRLVIRILPPFVAVSEATDPSDFDPLIDRLIAGDPVAPMAVLRTFQALRFARVEHRDMWIDVMVRLADAPAKAFAWDMARTLSELVANDQQVERVSVSAIAQKLFDWAWSHRGDSDGYWYDNFASNLVLPILLEWGNADLVERVVPNVLGLLEEPAFPIRYFTTLCDHAGDLAESAPSLVADIYEAVFLHEESSDEPTPLFGGVVIPMQSTRKQDFDLCHYQLKKEYPAYLDANSSAAAKVAFRLLDRLVQQRLFRYLREGRTLHDLAFEIESEYGEISLLEDYGHDWFPGREEVKEIADRAQERLESDPTAIEPTALVELFVTDIRCTSLWSRLFKIGAAHPASFAAPLSNLATVPGLVARPSLAPGLIAFLKTSYGYWREETRKSFEGAVLNSKPLVEKEHLRNSLLRAIPVDEAILQDTRTAQSNLDQEVEEEPWQPGVRIGPAVRAVDNDYNLEILERAGVDLSDPDVATWREIEDELTSFRSDWLNDVPGEDEVAEVVPDIRRLQEDVPPDAPIEGVLVTQLWTALAGAAETVSRLDSARQGETFDLVRSVLLTAGTKFPAPEGQPPEEYTMLSWSPSPRIAAAEGLPRLLLEGEDEEVKTALEDLLRSPSPAERAVTLLHLPYARECCDDWFGALVREAAEREGSPGVARAVFRSVTFLRDDRDQIARGLVSRWKDADNPELQRTIGDWLTYLVFQKDDEESQAILSGLLQDAETATDGVLSEVVVQALHLLAIERFAEEDPEIVNRIVMWVADLTRELQSKVEEAREEESGAWLQAAHQLVERIVSRTYFNIRTDEKRSDEVASEVRQRYYMAVRPILEAVVNFVSAEESQGMVPRTAHHFVEMMNEVLPYEPRETLAMTRTIAGAAGTHGYHLDSLAVGEVVKLVETLLADHRHLLLEADALDDLLTLLDQFADVGWPEALRLVWRLDEIFR